MYRPDHTEGWLKAKAEGAVAFSRGTPVDHCPYKGGPLGVGDLRVAWVNGWREALGQWELAEAEDGKDPVSDPFETPKIIPDGWGEALARWVQENNDV
jgi:ribosome modulation factor